ncbi:MATE family efflux transporter [Bacillus pumilus]|uniref:MATE family efflux transporter n=1 Tax=Bacillus pumilus TaxID=1408 RepID=UPI00227FEEFC|nr:MATE family efflux transporter [Bacillus pumilus]MCY7539832.1 MATE family efflux transporter [Bacillus pumilus]MEC3593772.1 MATE family efflux transporter [Bacillus pumilus]
MTLDNNQSLVKTMSIFLVPLLLSNILQSIGQLVSIVLVGRWIGEDAVAAISAFFPLFFLLVSFSIGIGSGSSILIGQAYGAKNEQRLKEIIGTTLSFTFLIGLSLAIIGGFFATDILNLMGTPANIVEESAAYARILFISMPILFLYFVYTTFLRGTGDSKTPFYFLMISTATNILMLPILLFGWLGLPAFGLYGAAYASVISTIVTFIILQIYLYKTKHPLRIDASVRKHFLMKGDLLKTLLKLSIPSSINMILISLSEIAVISFVNDYGSQATAAYGVVNQVVSYVQMPAVSLGIAVSIFAAQFIGAGNINRLKDVIKIGLGLNFAIGGFIIIIVYLFAPQILSIFLTDSKTIDIAFSLVVITLWSYLIFGTAQIVAATMRASGTVLWPTIFSICSIWLVEVPVAYVLSHYTTLGIKGIWIGYPAAFFVNLLLQYGYYQLVWKKKQIVALVQS